MANPLNLPTAPKGESPDVLEAFARDLSQIMAGEVENAKLLYLIGTSRIFRQPMHAVIKGPSAAGKSELRRRVLQFFPESEIINFTSLSEHALLHEEESFANKIISMDEAMRSRDRTLQDLFLRELMSSGRIVHKTTAHVKGIGPVTKTITKTGPVSFWVLCGCGQPPVRSPISGGAVRAKDSAPLDISELPSYRRRSAHEEGMQIAAPVSRSNTGMPGGYSERNRVVLSKAEAEICRLQGVDPIIYAEGKLRLAKEKKLGLRQNG